MKVPSKKLIKKIIADAKRTYRRFIKKRPNYRYIRNNLVLPFICGGRIDSLYLNKDLEMEHIETIIETDKTYHVKIDVKTGKVIEQITVKNQDDYIGSNPFKPVMGI